MKLLLREIAIRRTTKRLLQKKSNPDTSQIQKLTGEIFELQRTLLVKFQHDGMLVTP
ncbi:MAG: hypothetical protein KAR01_12580 [Desulfocapsa sp.]|nr:hypothetical protein [Desulfocapsa sp.]